MLLCKHMEMTPLIIKGLLMKYINKISKAAAGFVLRIAKFLISIITPVYLTDAREPIPYRDVVLDDGFLRIVSVMFPCTETGVRFKPFPFEPFRLQFTAFTAETGLRILVTIPFILSIGFLYAPARFKKRLGWVRYGAVVTVSHQEITLTKYNHITNRSFPLVEFYWSSRGNYTPCRWILHIESCSDASQVQDITVGVISTRYKLIPWYSDDTYFISPTATDHDWVFQLTKPNSNTTDGFYDSLIGTAYALASTNCSPVITKKDEVSLLALANALYCKRYDLVTNSIITLKENDQWKRIQ